MALAELRHLGDHLLALHLVDQLQHQLAVGGVRAVVQEAQVGLLGLLPVLQPAVALAEVEQQAGQRVEQVGMLDVAKRLLRVPEVVLERRAVGEHLRVTGGVGGDLARAGEDQREQRGREHGAIVQQRPADGERPPRRLERSVQIGSFRAPPSLGATVADLETEAAVCVRGGRRT